MTIEEGDRPGAAHPERIVVRARGDALAVTLDMTVEGTTVTRMREGLFGAGLEFLQLRTQYRVSGRVRDRRVDFSAAGSAETFRNPEIRTKSSTGSPGDR